jgi:LmbE family N-acetylglucosaminyl deacetylase|tara:strand:+ start:1549 stop:2361 length:813 start_codon:yes stop_codon:yes gene_type:complete
VATVVFLHAHPDDEALATGGTMARMADEGHRVVLVVATSGEEGEPVPGVLATGESLGDRRVAELAEAAEILGVERLVNLGYRDSGMVGEDANGRPDCFWQADVDEAAAYLASALADEAPDVLVVYDPDGGYGHPDHIQVHRVGHRWAEMADIDRVRWVTMNRDAIRTSIEAALADEDSWSDDGMLEQRRDRAESESFGMPDAEITHAIDVSTVIGRKRAAIAAHASQIAPESFFLAMPDEQFASAFGTEWFVDPGNPRRGGPQRTDLLLA